MTIVNLLVVAAAKAVIVNAVSMLPMTMVVFEDCVGEGDGEDTDSDAEDGDKKDILSAQHLPAVMMVMVT